MIDLRKLKKDQKFEVTFWAYGMGVNGGVGTPHVYESWPVALKQAKRWMTRGWSVTICPFEVSEVAK